MKNTILSALGLTLALLLAPGLPAATVQWTITAVSAPSDVSTTGLFVGAMNVGGAGTVQTVNGVTFGADPGGTNTALALGAATVAFSFDNSFDNNMWAGANPGGSAAYNTALDTARYSDGGSRSGTVTLGSLGIGRVYQVQLWIVDTRGGSLSARIRTVDGVSTLAGSTNLATGTFTADATTQVITIIGTNADPAPHGQIGRASCRERV